ncbi:MAG: phosphoribosylamine--glycine ligase, partial [Candidatus Methanomethylicota archaeon]
ADNIEEAREIAYKGINAIKGGSLWFRKDIASKDHIERSIQHMKKLRGY